MSEAMELNIGLDIGSTTIKAVVIDPAGSIVFSHYERHYSQITEMTAKLLDTIDNEILFGRKAAIMVSGSAGLGMADRCRLPFIQEVHATRLAAKNMLPDTDVIIELGGEDAKILFLTHGMEVRMNGTCAGGTGSFIDQMATLLGVDINELDGLAAKAHRTYTIASRCGVFAKSDVQPLLNQGAKQTDIAASILNAVVNQTIGGLAQGRPIIGNVVYLGGPLTFIPQLRSSFDTILNIKGICPENSLFYVALGAAFCATSEIDIPTAIETLQAHRSDDQYASISPLFTDALSYEHFKKRHAKATVPITTFPPGKQEVYLGIDAGSTTVKTVVIDKKGNILQSTYQGNSGNPVPIIKNILEQFYVEHPEAIIISSGVTGYGEHIIKEAFTVDAGVVETVAHFLAARHFLPDVDFVIDIGGQDIKCFKIHNKVVDNIFLNEACSSGCGSFLQTFATALGTSIDEFAKLGLFATHPVDLGSRCTVFMNSSVKQAQKEGSSLADISAGLSISVVKNALYKVIRTPSADALGKHIVVQGGTFLNDAVLRAFEQELQVEVIRPDIAGLMGAYGAALHAAEVSKGTSTILGIDDLRQFKHTVSSTTCRRCTNLCKLTVNTFDHNRRYISGNRCEKPLGNTAIDDSLNLYAYKLEKIVSYAPCVHDSTITDETIGIPLGLNMFELLPFWSTFFKSLGRQIVIPPLSNRDIYLLGQGSIPSDTICFPAKLVHGQVQYLLNAGVKTIFYPSMTYNIDEQLGDNHFNCPVVAYYPEVLDANLKALARTRFVKAPVGLHKKDEIAKKLRTILKKTIDSYPLSSIRCAVEDAYAAYDAYLSDIRTEGRRIIEAARQKQMTIIVLAGRPYHIDPEVNHGIDRLIHDFGVAVISEDVFTGIRKKIAVDVLNQWTYHARLYAAAEAIANEDDIELVQLVSFGCGLDAITSDETRAILESHGKMYTQLKIDEIANLGSVRIRIRSLLAAIEQKKRQL